MNSAAQLDVETAARFKAPQPILDAYQLIIAAQRGDLGASEQLLDWQSAVALPNEAYEAIVRCCQINNKLERAAHILDQLEKSADGSLIVSYQRGRNREIAEDFAGAAELYAKSLKSYPTSPRAAFRAGKCYYQLRDFDQARVMFSKAQSQPYQPIAAIELATCLWELNKFDEAAVAIGSMLELDPTFLQALYLQVDEYVDSDRAGLVGARIADARGKTDQAINLLQRVLAFNHREFEARSLLIKNLRLVNRVTEADELAKIQSQMIANRQRSRELRMELEEDPRNIDKLCELAELYWYTESTAEAQLVISEIFDLDPNCVRAQELLAKIVADQKGKLQPK